MSAAMNAAARLEQAAHDPLRPSSAAVGSAVSRPSDSRLGALSTAVADLAGRYGRSPASATSWRLGQGCVVTALDAFLTPAEQALAARGEASLVRQLRSAFAAAVRDEYVGAAERALGRRVIAHRSEIISTSGICLEIFLLGRGRARPGASPPEVDVPDRQRRRA